MTFVNPEPLALFADVIAAGEGEILIPDLADVLRQTRQRDEVLARLAGRRGFYIPELYDVRYGSGRRDRGIRAESRGAGDGPQGRGQDHRAARSAGDVDLHAGHRVRLAVPDRGRARLRQSVPLLLGRLQLPAGPRVSDRSHPAARRRRAQALRPRRAGVDRALRPSGNRPHPAQPDRHGLLDQPGVAAPGRPHRADPADASRERRTLDHDRAGGRLRPAPPRDQQDRDQRGDSRRHRADLRQRHGEPEAVLHDRPAHRNRRRPGGDSRSDGPDARHHDAPRQKPRPHRPHRRQRESA